MVYLLASILSSSMIYVVFRLAKNYSCNLSTLITINYLTATILGFLLFQPTNGNLRNNVIQWLPFGILLGVLFIVMFYLIGNSSQKAGIAVTTLANKLSLVFPVLFSLLYFNEKITLLKTTGLITAFIAVFLTVYKKEIKKTNLLFLILPVVIFIGSGITDSVVKFVQAVKINSEEASIFSSLVFLVAFVIGVIISFSQKKTAKLYHFPTLALGTLLGIVNFGSLYFIINALNKSNLNSSMVFTINNMSIVSLSAILGTFLFHEKLNKINIAGIFLALLSLYFLI
ncbi:MAG: EamA family transporter [Bacteroidetes bacterium]|nr:EamA family transporter [Bacteroidota bacterium]